MNDNANEEHDTEALARHFFLYSEFGVGTRLMATIPICLFNLVAVAAVHLQKNSDSALEKYGERLGEAVWLILGFATLISLCCIVLLLIFILLHDIARVQDKKPERGELPFLRISSVFFMHLHVIQLAVAICLVLVHRAAA